MMTVSLTLRQRLLVMHSASGMLSIDFSKMHDSIMHIKSSLCSLVNEMLIIAVCVVCVKVRGSCTE